MTKWFNGQAQYALAHAYNDTNGINWFPANDYDLSANTRAPISTGCIGWSCSAASLPGRSPTSASV
jgi:hypothetical protein